MHARFLLPDGFHVDSAGLGTVLLFTDGANQQWSAQRTSWLWYRLHSRNPLPKGVSFHLAADDGPPTSNRAELLVAINALMMRVWTGEGFARIAIATDSEYVVGYVNMCSLGRV
jgi:ribonuclease HI